MGKWRWKMNEVKNAVVENLKYSDRDTQKKNDKGDIRFRKTRGR